MTPTYTATLTPIGRRTYEARVHPSADPHYGDHWTWGCNVRRLRPPLWRRLWLRLTGRRVEVVAFLSLALRSPTPEEAAALRAKLVAEGYTRRAHERFGRGGRRRVYEEDL